MYTNAFDVNSANEEVLTSFPKSDDNLKINKKLN